MIKVFFTGSRKKYWSGHENFVESFIHEYIERLSKFKIVVGAGESPGAGVDSWTKESAQLLGIEYVPFHPETFDKKGFLDRNIKGVQWSNVVVAFHFPGSTGTAHTFKTAINKGKHTVIYTWSGSGFNRKEYNA